MLFTNGSKNKSVAQILLLNYIVLVGMLPKNAFAQFVIEPESVVQAEGLEAVFECLVTGASFHIWTVNGVGQSSSEFPRDITVIGATSGNPSILTIPARSQFNNSVVQCEGFPMNVLSRNVTLIFEQVAIDVVNGADDITISVTNNFTANLTYQLNVTRTTNESSETFFTIITMTKFNFDLPNRTVCDVFSFIVIPTTMEMKGRPSEPPIVGFFTAATVDDVALLIRQNEDLKKKSITLSSMVPGCSNNEFISYSVNTSSDVLAEPITGNITDSQVIFTLPTDIRTNITVTLTSTLGIQLIFRKALIKTFDVQNILVSEYSGVGINVNITYVEGTLSPGALVCVLPRVNGVLDSSFEVFAISRSRSDNFTMQVPSGEYRVIAFDLESETIPRSPVSIAAEIKDIVVASDNENTPSPPPNNEDITVTVLSNQDVQVTCPQPLNCLVLVQSLASLDTLHVWFIESFVTSAIFSLDTVSNDNYMVVYSWDSEQSIFDGRVSLITSLNPPTVVPTSGSSTDPPPGTVSQSPLPIEAIAGISVAAVFLLLCVCVGITIIVLLRIKKLKDKVEEVEESDEKVDWSSTLSGIEQPNEAYGINKMLKKNIAYEQTKTRTQRQRMDHSPVLALTEGGEYEDIKSVHQYEEVLSL